MIYQPIGISLDPSGNLFISDTYNNCVREVNVSTSIISTIAGNTIVGFSGDGGPATAAELWYPHKSAVNSLGNIYFTDAHNNRIREIVAPLNITANVTTNINCNGGSNGTAMVSSSGGTSPYTYLWNPVGYL